MTDTPWTPGPWHVNWDGHRLHPTIGMEIMVGSEEGE